MAYLSTDHLIVYVFLLITLAVGLWAGGGVKDIREYSIANKQFGTGPLTMTLLATYIGGWHVFGFPSDVFADGLTQIIPEVVCGVVVCLLFIAWFIAPKMIFFKGCLTMGDLMKIFYGEYGQMLTGVLGLIYNTAAIGIQIVFLGHLCELLGIKSDWGLILPALILTIYTAKGGMKAVVVTDMLQFIAIIAAVPLLAHLITCQAGGIRVLLSSVPMEKLQLFNFGQDKSGAFSASYYALPVLTLWMLFPGFPLSFPFIQRMLMAKQQQQSANIYYISIAFLVPFFLLLTLIGLAALVVYPQINSQDVMAHIVNNLPVGLKGLVWTALMAVVMSTTDSFLHAAGVSLTHDLIKPLLGKKGIATNELKVAHYTTLFIGCLAIAAVLGVRSISKIAMYGMDFTALLFTIPLVAGIMGLKTGSRTFLVSSIITVTVFVFSRFCISHEFIIPVAIAANALSFFGTHYFQHKGFAVVNRAGNQQVGHVWHPTWEGASKRFLSLIPTPKKLLSYSRYSLEKYGANPTGFALFMSLSYMIPIFMHGYAAPHVYNCLLTIRGIGALLCVGLLLKAYWPKQLLFYFPIYYHFSLLYCLPFTASFLFFLEGSGIECLINITLAILLLITLVDWVTFVLLTLLGAVLGIVVYSMLLGRPIAAPDSDTMYTLVYTLTFSTLIGLLFARRKQLHFDTLATQREQLASDNQETKDDLLEATKEKFRVASVLKNAGIGQLGSVAHLSKRLLELSKKQGINQEFTTLAQQLTDQLTPMALNMDRFVHRTTGFLLLDGVETLPLDNFLQALQQTLYDKGHRFKIAVCTQHKTLQCDVEKMKKVILNSFAFMHSVSVEEEKESVLLGIEDTQLGYAIASVSPGHVKQVRALRFTITVAHTLPKLAALYMSQIGEESIMKPEAPTNMPLLANERIIKAHYGYSSTLSEGKQLTLVYVIPVDVREVRSKDMDTPQMPLGASWPRADDTYPGAKEQEQAFLRAVKERSKTDLSLVDKAIRLIKDYHGPVMRKSGEPFYLHPLAVAQIVLDYNTDEATVLGALLHDTVEDTPLTLEQVELLFNKEVRTIVQGVTHMESNQETIYQVLLSHPENIHRLLGAEDKRVLYVKLADRIHNMRTIQAKSYKSRHRTAEETLLFFVPLARYLGLMEAAEELKNMSFGVLHVDSR